MNLLAQLYSYGDGLKRKVNGLLSDPIGAASLGAARMAEDQQGLLGLMDQAGYTPGSKSVLQQPQDMQQARNSLADAAMQSYGGLLGATVWHGSPHKFNKFDSSKIGTGEGAQAYGHGLYLADNPAVAKQYADTLGFSGAVDKGGNQYGKYELASFFEDKLKAKGIPADAAKSQASMWADKFSKGEKISHSAALDVIESKGLKPVDTGSLYKVDLPDEQIAKMLDWDKPLSQQPQAFKDAVSAREQQRMMPILEQRRATLAGLPQGAENASILKKQIAILEDEITQPQAVPNMTGGEYFNYLRNREMAPAEQADWLRKAGIPGIRYLDGGSRGAGGGTSNFVVFPGNEGLLQILERNGSPIN